MNEFFLFKPSNEISDDEGADLSRAIPGIEAKVVIVQADRKEGRSLLFLRDEISQKQCQCALKWFPAELLSVTLGKEKVEQYREASDRVSRRECGIEGRAIIADLQTGHDLKIADMGLSDVWIEGIVGPQAELSLSSDLR